jgi:hypothetical protein
MYALTFGRGGCFAGAVRAGEEFYSEITAVGSRPGQCIPVNELTMSGMYLEAVSPPPTHWLTLDHFVL